jgi:hypothetical protein
MITVSSTSTAGDKSVSAGVFIAIATIIWLLFTQFAAIYEATTEGGLSSTADPYGEADAVRSAEFYAKYGFAVDAGLPHIVFGERFPNKGWVRDLQKYPLPSGVYTRYAPLPNFIVGVLEMTVGYHLGAWRLVPIFLGLCATAYAFTALRAVFGPTRGGVMILLLSVAPMVASYMHGLHFEGYAHSAFLVQLALLVRILFSREPVSLASYAALFGLGFLQGWLSFEYAFVVTGAVIPLALLAGTGRSEPIFGKIWPIVLLCGGGFTLAHVLHFAQVAAFYHSFAGALEDYSGRAMYRFSGGQQKSYLMMTSWVCLKYLRILWFNPRDPHFGPLMFLLSFSVLGYGIAFRVGLRPYLARFPERLMLFVEGRILQAVLWSYGLAAIWVLVMPSHAEAHTHIVPRIFFLAYFVMVVVFVLAVFKGSSTDESTKALPGECA